MLNTQATKKAELLCPAGSPLALAAAIEGGADAIYVGGTAFNARINAKNFTPDELREGISLAHTYGTKVYIAANTLIHDRELDTMLKAAEEAYLAGADALIVADLGAARQIRDRIPIPLHASTQLSGHNVDAARVLADAGFSRMVCAREMSREDLRYFTEHSPIEAEVFVHGALCVCHSGQCLFSSLVGGRSGNRGECAQPCRLPFATPGGVSYPLSLKDLSLARHVPELMEMGVASFKIEGRMKSPEYVREVTRIFRRLIDQSRGASNEEMADLAAVFSRGGLTDGYYEKKISRAMLGRRSEEDKQNSRALEPFQKITRKLPVHLSVSIKVGQPVTFSVWDDLGSKASLTSEIPQQAKTAPLTKESVIKSFTKLGNTPYEAADIKVDLDEGLMLPVSVMNGLRRETIQAFQNASAPSPRSPEDFAGITPSRPKKMSEREATAACYRPSEIPREAREFFKIIYVPIEHFDGTTKGIMLPPVIFDGERQTLEDLLRRAKEMGAEHALIGNLGHLKMVQKIGLIPHGDFRLNVMNGESAAVLESLGLEDVILSPELTLPQLRDIGGAAKTVVYGRIPLMVTEKCVGKELGGCDPCQSGKLHLTDRRGVSFPVLKEWQHRSLILNSVPLYMADRNEELRRYGIQNRHFIFTTESKNEILRILEAYEKSLPPRGDVRRIR